MIYDHDGFSAFGRIVGQLSLGTSSLPFVVVAFSCLDSFSVESDNQCVCVCVELLAILAL